MTAHDPQADERPLLVLTGATASGKKEVGLALARILGAEVVGLDSIKLYRGFGIGGAQPDAAEAAGVPLHLLAIADPADAFSVGRYLEAAAAAVATIRDRGRVPLFLGGTPLYLRALLRGFVAAPPADPVVRAELEAIAARDGVAALHAALAGVDPDSAAWIGPRDLKRIVRALEVHRATGEPLSKLQRERTERPIAGRMHVVGLRCERELLRARQRARVDRMLERGLVAEVAALHARGALRGEAGRAIGYRELIPYLEGEIPLETAREAIVRDTHELTRKQYKWFRRFEEIRWVERDESSTTDSLVAAVLAEWVADGFRLPP
jgi:tRNA dimethylallyltransferase